MPKAIWKGVVLAESDNTILLEGNHYFPPESIHREYFRPAPETTTCPWKGVARYFDIVVNGEVNRGAAWYYPNPSAVAAYIKNHVAFWRGVQVVSTDGDAPRTDLAQSRPAS